MDEVGSKFKSLEYPFLVDIVSCGKHIVSLNSDSIRIRICKKSKGKMIEWLKITVKTSGKDGEVTIVSNEKDHKLLFRMKKEGE